METASVQGERHIAQVETIEQLNVDTVRVNLSCPAIADYRAGQYLKVFLDDDTMRYYSLASAPRIDKFLQLHVRRGGANSASHWFHDVLRVGDTLKISAPQGHCCHDPSYADSPIMMIATGSGLAPFYGIARDVLHAGHEAPIYLYHGVRHVEHLYLVEQLRSLSYLYPNFHYLPCVSGSSPKPGFIPGRALDLALCNAQVAPHWQIFLGGNAAMIEDAWRAFRQLGIPADRLKSDYVPRSPVKVAAVAA